jgi:peroxiredoxin
MYNACVHRVYQVSLSKESIYAPRHHSREYFPRLSAERSHVHAAEAQRVTGEYPLILTLARGHYCPKEHQQHLELSSFYPKIAVGYTQVATISTDDHHTLQEFRASVGAQWTFLSDPDRTLQKDLDIQEYRSRT